MSATKNSSRRQGHQRYSDEANSDGQHSAERSEERQPQTQQDPFTLGLVFIALT